MWKAEITTYTEYQKLCAERRDRILMVREKGVSVTAIAEFYKLSKSRIYQILETARREGLERDMAGMLEAKGD